MADRRNAQEPDEILEDIEDAAPPNNAQLEEVSALAAEQLRLLAAKAAAEAALAEIEALLKLNKEQDLPQAMAKCRMTSFKLDDGSEVSTSKVVRAGIPSEEKDPANHAAGLAYMKREAPELIKRVVALSFGKGEGKLYDKAMKALKPLLGDLDLAEKESVHFMTLGKWVRDQDKKAKALPLEPLGIYRATVAEVKPAKVKL